jgi:2-phospho-L-lactate guanylyltransferase
MPAMDRGEGGPMRTFAIVPVRALEGAKSRLGAALDAEERRDLVVALLQRTLAALAAARRVDRTIVVSNDEDVLDIARNAGALPLRQLGGGLNAALAQARIVAVELGARELLVVPGDLAAVSSRALDAVVEVADAGRGGDGARHDDRPDGRAAHGSGATPVVVLVPDRHGRGTNALLLRPPDVIPFAFGGDSRLAHAALARQAGVTYLEARGPLDLDLDTPDDLLLIDGVGTDG